MRTGRHAMGGPEVQMCSRFRRDTLKCDCNPWIVSFRRPFAVSDLNRH
jgi:hypothetical protein